MAINRLSRSLQIVCGILIGLQTCSLATAQQPPEPDGEKKADETLREQTIYIPYKKLRDTFEKKGRGVFLPYDKFQELWKAARGKPDQDRPKPPPVPALITAIESEATVEEEVVRVKAKLKIDLLQKGWVEVPLRLGDAAIQTASIAGQPARLLSNNGSYSLLVENKEQETQQVSLDLEYVKSFSKVPGQNSVAFQAPTAPVNQWKIHIPEPGVKVNIHPLLAASEVPADAAAEQKKEETLVHAFVGAAPTVRIDWTPKAEGAKGLEALVSVRAEQEFIIGQGVTRTTTRLNYRISRAELTQIEFEVPADQKVVNVFDANVRQWNVAKAEQVQKVTVQLFEPARDKQNLTVVLEKFSSDKQQSEVTVPQIKALAVGRQQGVVVVQLGSGLRGEVKSHTGLLQLDMAEMPASLRNQSWHYSYRYATLPYELVLGVEKIKPQIEIDTLTEAYLEPEKITLSLLARYQVKGAGVFELGVEIPAGFQVRTVRGHSFANAQAAAYDSHLLEGEKKTDLRVNLRRKAFGSVGLLILLEKRLDDPNLLSPTGKTSEIDFSLPRPVDSSIERSQGNLVVYGPESLRINAEKNDAIRDVSFREAFSPIAAGGQGRPDDVRPVLAYEHSEGAVAVKLTAQRRKPHVTVKQMLIARVEDGEVKYEATFFYTIRYSGVPFLRIDLPESIVGNVRSDTKTIRESTMQPPPEGVAEDYVAWAFVGETELLGTHQLKLSWETPIDKLEVGKPIEVEIPRLVPQDTDIASGQIVLVKSESIDVRPAQDVQGLRPIDPQRNLLPGVSVPDAARAFEFFGPWNLKISATRYQLVSVKRTSIDRAVMRMVINRGGKISVQALYRMRSARQRVEVNLPMEMGADALQFDTQPVRINGRAVTIEEGKDKRTIYVPLVGHSADQAFLLELRYTIPGDAGNLPFPVFSNEPAEQKIYLAAYLPEELVYLGSRGPWTEELNWYGKITKKPYPKRRDQELVQWVCRDVIDSGPLLAALPTDGRMVLFSTLRPAPPDEGGTLRLTVVDERLLSAVVFGGILLLGILLFRAGLRVKLLALVAVIVAVVLLGVFLPTLSRQVFNANFYAAIGFVLLVWFGFWLIQGRTTVAGRRRDASETAEPDTGKQEEAVAAVAASGAEESKQDAGSPEGSEEDPQRKEDSSQEGDA